MVLVEHDLEQIEKIVDQSVEQSGHRIISILSREITNLAEINRAVIARVGKIDDLEKRIIRIETKMGIAN